MGRYSHVGLTQIIQFATSGFHQYFFTCKNIPTLQVVLVSTGSSALVQPASPILKEDSRT
jgi:hypothetical protein